MSDTGSGMRCTRVILQGGGGGGGVRGDVKSGVLAALQRCANATPAPSNAATPAPAAASRQPRRASPPQQQQRSSAHDKRTAGILRYDYLRHVKRAWMQNYTEARNARRRMMTYFMERRREEKLGPESYTAVLSFFSVLGMLDRCEKVFNLARSDGVRPTADMWESLLACYAKKGRVHKVLRGYRTLTRVMPATNKMLVSVVTAIAKHGRTADSLAAVACVLEATGPQAEMYTHALAACGSREHLGLVLADMRAAQVELLSASANAAVQSCYRTNDVEQAWRIVHGAERSGLRIDLPVLVSLLSGFRKAGDVHGLRRLLTMYLDNRAEPSPILFMITMSAFVDAGDLSSARLTFAVANSWKLSENLRIFTKAVSVTGLTGNAKNVLAAFDARPLGKYTPTMLVRLLWSLASCVLAGHAAPSVALQRVLVSYPHVRDAEALLVLARHSFLLRGYGARAVWRRVRSYAAARRNAPGEPSPVSPGVHRILSMAAARRVRRLVERADGGASGGGGNLREARSAADVVLEMFDGLLEEGSPTAASVVLPQLLGVCGDMGAPLMALRCVERLLDKGPLWACHLRGHFGVLCRLAEAAGQADLSRRLTEACEQDAAQQLYFHVALAGKPDFLDEERSVVKGQASPSRRAAAAGTLAGPDAAAAAERELTAMREAGTVAEVLECLSPGVPAGGGDGAAAAEAADASLPHRSLLLTQGRSAAEAPSDTYAGAYEGVLVSA